MGIFDGIKRQRRRSEAFAYSQKDLFNDVREKLNLQEGTLSTVWIKLGELQREAEKHGWPENHFVAHNVDLGDDALWDLEIYAMPGYMEGDMTQLDSDEGKVVHLDYKTNKTWTDTPKGQEETVDIPKSDQQATTESVNTETKASGTNNERTMESGGAYKVQAGDSLWKIAHDNGTTVEALSEANKELLKKQGDVIHPGDKLVLPTKAKAEKAPAKEEAKQKATTNKAETSKAVSGPYKVKKGDSLWKIAHTLGVDFDALEEANKELLDKQDGMIHPGNELIIPDKKNKQTVIGEKSRYYQAAVDAWNKQKAAEQAIAEKVIEEEMQKQDASYWNRVSQDAVDKYFGRGNGSAGVRESFSDPWAAEERRRDLERKMNINGALDVLACGGKIKKKRKQPNVKKP